MPRRLLLVPIGLVLAIAAGMIFLLIAGLAEPASRRLLEGVGWVFLLAVRSDAMQGDPPASYLALAARIMWWATLAITIVPVTLGAAIGEVARLRSFLWHIGFPAMLTAATPWLARGLRSAGSAAIREAAARGVGTQADDARLTVLLFVSGAFTGFIYWAVAGRDAGSAPRPNAGIKAPVAPRS